MQLPARLSAIIHGILLLSVISAVSQESPTFKLDNPVNPEWLLKHLNNVMPRLILTPENQSVISEKLKSDPVLGLSYDLIKRTANEYLDQPLLERKKTGIRLLSVSREAVSRISTLALVYRLEEQEIYLKRLQQEIETVCAFSDWNPSHFLDVAEMAFAVAIGLDWCGMYLPDDVVQRAKRTLLEKAIKVSFREPPFGWVTAPHNWNQVCHGGLSAAAIVIAEDEPEWAARILSRTLDNLHYALAAYAPDGAFLEGASYWFYATYYTVILGSMFESAFGTDFNLKNAPGLRESADYTIYMIAPSGEYYNYFDAAADGAYSLSHLGILNWFDLHYGNAAFYNTELYTSKLEEARDEEAGQDRFAPIVLTWLAQNPRRASQKDLPDCWVGRGPNPLAVMRDTTAGGAGFYLAAKGGRASLNHGNMDAGSFIFELNGVRWSVDPGNQGYHQLEQVMGDGLWNVGQNSPRWTLLTKNNFGHSTLTVNDQLHDVNGKAPLIHSFCDLSKPNATFDLTDLFYTNISKVERTFLKKNHTTLQIIDKIQINEATRKINWHMITTASVEKTAEGAKLTQDNMTLMLRVLAPDKFRLDLTPLDPPPLSYDKKIDNLKRIEIAIISDVFEQGSGEIVVELGE